MKVNDVALWRIFKQFLAFTPFRFFFIRNHVEYEIWNASKFESNVRINSQSTEKEREFREEAINWTHSPFQMTQPKFAVMRILFVSFVVFFLFCFVVFFLNADSIGIFSLLVNLKHKHWNWTITKVNRKQR